MLLLCGLISACSQGATPPVVVYTALDEMYSRPLLDTFEAQTGIEVLAVYDTEAAKTTGLVTRLIAERERPRADVFWNNETAQTILLQHKGVLEAYESPSAAVVPDRFKDPDHYWTGFAARGRVIIYNTDLVPTPPTSLRDLVDPRWKGKAAMAAPLFGTTATHAAALFALWGEDKARQFFADLRENEVAVLAGNATVRDAVVRGDYAFGLTDTDDANGAIEDGAHVKWVFPDQDGEGTLVIPNSVALIANAPNPEAGRKLIDYLLSPEVEAQLAQLRSIQIPLKPGVAVPEKTPRLEAIKTYGLGFTQIAEKMEQTAAFIQREFLK